MGLLQYEYDNETRIIHFCKHEVIKDRVPEAVDTVSGSWYVKEPREQSLSLADNMDATIARDPTVGVDLFQQPEEA